jgi:hypothetical protein
MLRLVDAQADYTLALAIVLPIARGGAGCDDQPFIRQCNTPEPK